MTSTIVKIAKGVPDRDHGTRALRDAGVTVVEVDSWEGAARALGQHPGAVVVCDCELLESADFAELHPLIEALEAPNTNTSRIPPDVARTISHELRTPLSAMAGWLHLLETGKLDAEGVRKAINKLRGNIDDQVRTIDRYLGSNPSGRS